MKRIVSIGTQDFEKLRKNNSFYIDKTDFIKEWWENGDDATLITRPRRFGKTLNMNMIEKFFSVKYEKRSDLFEGLSIWNEEKYRKMQGTYPVIFLSFADIKADTFESARMGIIYKLVGLYNSYEFIKTSGKLSDKEIVYFDSVDIKMTDNAAYVAVNYLSEYLSRYYGKKAIIILDEYDTPLQEAYISGYWDKMVPFIRNLFNSTFKTNPYMERAILTGITRVSKESIFSDLNNLEVVTAISEKYETAFGFTEEEVIEALKEFDLDCNFEKVKSWYDGFRFGNREDIYNPWSITKYLDSGKFGTYWADTSGNALISKLIKEGSVSIKTAVEDLLAGKEIRTILDEQVVFEQLNEKKGAIWSLLLASGYLKCMRINQDDNTGKELYNLKITNHETMIMFQNMIENWFSENEQAYDNFKKALITGDLDYMNQYMRRIAMQTFSSFDTGRKPSDEAEPERFYHGFVLGLIVDLAGRYRITSNRESGFGRYDVMLKPLEKELPAIIIEFKVFNKRKEKNIEETVKNALLQIEEKCYDTELIAEGIEKERIKHYGFAFEGKNVLIGEKNKRGSLYETDSFHRNTGF